MKLSYGPILCYLFDSTKLAKPIRPSILQESWSNMEQWSGMVKPMPIDCASARRRPSSNPNESMSPTSSRACAPSARIRSRPRPHQRRQRNRHRAPGHILFFICRFLRHDSRRPRRSNGPRRAPIAFKNDAAYGCWFAAKCQRYLAISFGARYRVCDRLKGSRSFQPIFILPHPTLVKA